MKERQRKIVLLLSIMVTVSIILSIFYVNKEANHRCFQQECSVCVQLHKAQELLSQIKGIIIRIACYLLADRVFQLVVIKKRPVLKRHSPITLKVKLLN